MHKLIKKKVEKDKTKFRLGETERAILATISVGLIITACLVAPGLPLALKPFFKKRGKKKFTETIKKLEKKGLINLGGEKIRLTDKGRRLQKIIGFEDITINKPEQWDGLWRLVSYDVPEIGKKERDYFRQTIEKWGFKKIQKSLWAFPFDCKEEIAVLAEELNVAPYVILMSTGKMPEQDKLKDYFNLIE